MDKQTTKQIIIKTAKQLESSSLKEGIRYKVNETNLYLSVYAKSRSFQYRNIIRNKTNWITIGKHKLEINLQDARTMAQEIRKRLKLDSQPEEIIEALKHSKDPYKLETNLKAIREPNQRIKSHKTRKTFEDVHMEWLELNKSRWTKKKYTDSLNPIRKWIYPYIANKNIDEGIEPKDLANAYNNMIENGLKDLIRKTRQIVDRVFRFALESKYTKYNPNIQNLKLSELVADYQNKSENRGYFKFEKLQEIAHKLTLQNDVWSMATLITMFTGKRPNEVATMKWDEVDLENKTWTKTENVKTSNIHRIPITNYMYTILLDLKGKGLTDYVFEYKENRIHTDSINKLVQQLMGNNKSKYKHDLSKNDPVAYGFRHNTETFYDDHLYNRLLTQKQLNHTDKSISDNYSHTDYLNQRRVMAQHYEDFCLDKARYDYKARDVNEAL